MVRTAALAVALVLASACGRGAGNGSGSGGGGGGGGTGTGSAADCEAIRAHVEELYRAEAAAGADPAVVEQAVTDNAAMVLAECAREPGRVAPCAGQAKSAPELESTCLAPLDDEGSEGDRFKPR